MRKNNLINKKFGRLTVIKEAENPKTRKNDTAAYWLCLCSCGKEVIIRGYSLKIGKTKSCGCLSKECSHLSEFKIPKYSHEDVVLKKIWKRKNRYVKIPFKKFTQLIQQSCYYCNSEPSLYQQSIRKESKKIYYNTLDRIDSTKDHILENVVPCCLTCNRAKLTRSIDQFKEYIFKLKNNKISPQEYRKLSKNVNITNLNKQYLAAVNMSYFFYNDEPHSLSLQQFYNLTQMDCYYCGEKPSNSRRYKLKRSSDQYYIYNGLDRIDNALGHSYDNVVPCCKYCNSAKGELTLAEFQKWVNKFK